MGHTNAEPKWLTDLDVAKGRDNRRANLAAYWATWAIAQLEPKLRAAAAKAWKHGKIPAECEFIQKPLPNEE